MVFVLFCFYAFLAGCNSPAFFVPLGMAMTIQQYIQKVNKAVKELEDGKAFTDAISATIVDQADRIFNDGLDASGGPIDKYSTKPTYIPVDAGPIKVKPLGKPHGKPKRARSVYETGKKAGKPYKSRYYKGGYAEFKVKMRRTGKFRLFLFGNFNRAFLRYGKFPTLLKEPTRMVAIFAIKPDESNPQGKINGLLKNYPNAFKLSINEKVNHRDRISRLWNNAFK